MRGGPINVAALIRIELKLEGEGAVSAETPDQDGDEFRIGTPGQNRRGQNYDVKIS